LNVPKWYVSCCTGIGLNNGFELCDKLDMKTSSFMGREPTYEPILVFRKK
jgi:hypothetical protein